jgi:prolyl-tRNA editing enzyme YbaK/EbsC (Cys-tRNA(Pro) deacylase)
VVRRHLEVRRISFGPQDQTVALTGREFGGITPIALPAGWPILVDPGVVEAETVIIGSGFRGRKLLVRASELVSLPAPQELTLAR